MKTAYNIGMNCEYCKKEFTTDRKDKKYCNKKCKKKASFKRGLETEYGRRRHWKRWGINITFGKYNDLLKIQEGKCKICGIHQTELKQRLGVDHDHITGKIRGLLCSKCNMGLGYFKDDPKILKEAIEYLQSL